MRRTLAHITPLVLAAAVTCSAAAGDSFFTIGSLWTDGTPFANNLLQGSGIASEHWSVWEDGGDFNRGDRI